MKNKYPGKKWINNFLPYILYRLSSKMRKDMKRKIRRHGLNNTAWRILAGLDSEESCSITGLTRITIMDQPTISRAIDKLESDKLVKRITVPNDSRKQNISLTKKGKDLVNTIKPIAFTHEDMVLNNFSSSEIKTLKSLLKRIGENIELENH